MIRNCLNVFATVDEETIDKSNTSDWDSFVVRINEQNTQLTIHSHTWEKATLQPPVSDCQGRVDLQRSKPELLIIEMGFDNI